MRCLRFALLSLALLLLTLPLLAKPAPPPDRPELRAFWVDGFNDGFKTPAQCDLLLRRLRAMHCNAVFVQMRKRADAYYDTHYEDWAQDDPDHFDALQYLCDHAHAKGQTRIQVHAWINACAIGGNAERRITGEGASRNGCRCRTRGRILIPRRPRLTPATRRRQTGRFASTWMSCGITMWTAFT